MSISLCFVIYNSQQGVPSTVQCNRLLSFIPLYWVFGIMPCKDNNKNSVSVITFIFLASIHMHTENQWPKVNISVTKKYNTKYQNNPLSTKSFHRLSFEKDKMILSYMQQLGSIILLLLVFKIILTGLQTVSIIMLHM